MQRDEAPVICYGKDGPVFERLCPKCARFLKFPKMLKYKVRILDDIADFPKLECSKCGPVDPVHIGWTGDFT